MKLSEYVNKEMVKHSNGLGLIWTVQNIFNYTKFLTQPLQLYQFVPCKEVNGKWEVLKHPDEIKDMVNESMEGAIQYKNYKEEYQEAKERCLFKNRDASDNDIFYHGLLMNKTIEYIIESVELTEKVKKQFNI